MQTEYFPCDSSPFFLCLATTKKMFSEFCEVMVKTIKGAKKRKKKKKTIKGRCLLRTT